MSIDMVKLLIVAASFLVYVSAFPICWKIYYTRHSPKDAHDEVWYLVFVMLSALCAAVTISGLAGKVFNHIIAGRYFFYSTMFGAILSIQATMMMMVKRRPRNPKGLKQTRLGGLILGFIVLVAVNITILLDIVPSL